MPLNRSPPFNNIYCLPRLTALTAMTHFFLRTVCRCMALPYGAVDALHQFRPCFPELPGTSAPPNFQAGTYSRFSACFVRLARTISIGMLPP